MINAITSQPERDSSLSINGLLLLSVIDDLVLLVVISPDSKRCHNKSVSDSNKYLFYVLSFEIDTFYFPTCILNRKKIDFEFSVKITVLGNSGLKNLVSGTFQYMYVRSKL